jgi:hypothetical protein
MDRAFGEQHHLSDDGHDMGELLGPNGGKPIDERFQMPEGSGIIRKEIAGLFSERFGDVDEVVDVQPALFGLQSGEVCRRDGHSSRHIRLAATFRLAKLPEDASIHAQFDCTSLAN